METDNYEDRGYRVEIHTDDDPLNPRTDYDNAGTMCCEHRRYNLGDEGGMRLLYDSLDDGNQHLHLDEDDELDLDPDDYAGMIKLALGRGYVVLPLFLYDHSGITMSTSEFGCQWDSGQVGVIFISPEQREKEQLTEEQAIECLKGEVSTYDQYLRNDVYGYIIYDDDGEQLDSCWGFFGSDYCKEEAQSVVEYYVKKNGEQLELLEEG